MDIHDGKKWVALVPKAGATVAPWLVEAFETWINAPEQKQALLEALEARRF